jgi:hypothetical protein
LNQQEESYHTQGTDNAYGLKRDCAPDA